MARLNESVGAPPESIENLKRRFVRQNREIARINSFQSLRIRGLEVEVSDLLAENISLREQVIALNREIDRLQAAKLLQRGVYDIKAKLDTKLAELSSLATELGSLPRKFQKSSNEERKRATLLELHEFDPDQDPRVTRIETHSSEADGRLPVILEDKYYPRLTLEVQEQQNLASKDQEALSSAGIDEPQDNQLDILDDNINKECFNEMAQLQEIPMGGGGGGDNDYLPPTLELRRKKRVNQSIPAGETPDSQLKDPTTPIPKQGSKRKFDPEEFEQYAPTLDSSDGAFEFSRRVPTLPTELEDTATEHTGYASNSGPADEGQRSQSCEYHKRKALEPKSTNTSVGQSKVNISNIRGHKAQQKGLGESENIMLHQVRDSKVACKQKDVGVKPVNRQPCGRKGEADNTELHIVQEPAVLKNSEQCQPREPAIPGGNELAAPLRSTRRQKAIVSYAEPNLRDKMRRPTNEFIDAVGSHGVRRNSSQAASRNANYDAERLAGDSSHGSQQAETGLSSLPKGPLGSPVRGAAGTAPTSLQRKRRTLPAKGGSPPASMDPVDEVYEISLEGGHSRGQQGYETIELAENAAPPCPSGTGAQDLGKDGTEDSSSHKGPRACHFGKPPPLSSKGSRRATCGQRISTRRKSMMV